MKKYGIALLCIVAAGILLYGYRVKNSEPDVIDQQEIALFKTLDLSDALEKIPQISIFSDVVTRSGLLPLLEEMSDLTLFVPSDGAFDELKHNIGPDAYDSVLHNQKYLIKIVSMHVIPKIRLTTTEKLPTRAVRTLEGDSLAITQEGAMFTIRGAAPVMSINRGDHAIAKETKTTGLQNIEIKNGVIHIIDKIISITVA